MGSVVDNSWQTAMPFLKVFISRLMDDGEVWKGSALQPFSIFISIIRKPIFTPFHLLVYATVSSLLGCLGGTSGHKRNISQVDCIHLC